jgi:hypothetical protein
MAYYPIDHSGRHTNPYQFKGVDSMSARKAYALLVVACFALMLVPLQAVFAADIPKLMFTEVMPNGANRPNPTTGKNYTEAYELMEIWNYSKQPIALKDFKIMFGPIGAEVELAWMENSADMVIPAGGVLVVWPKQASNPFTLEDFFQHNLAKNPELKKEQIAIVAGPQMHNTQPRSGSIVMADGTVVCTFAYEGVTTETIDDMAIRYAYPTDGSIQLRRISYGLPSTPGIVDAEQIPAQ